MSFSVFQLEKNFWHLFLFEESHIAHRKFQVHTQSLAISIDQKARNRTDSEKQFGVFGYFTGGMCLLKLFLSWNQDENQHAKKILKKKNSSFLKKRWERFLCCCCNIWL